MKKSQTFSIAFCMAFRVNLYDLLPTYFDLSHLQPKSRLQPQLHATYFFDGCNCNPNFIKFLQYLIFIISFIESVRNGFFESKIALIAKIFHF